MNTKKMLPIATILFCAIIFSACIPTEKEQVQQMETIPETMIESDLVPQDSTMEQNSKTQEEKIITIETSYTSPAGEEPVSFSLTVDNSGTIISAETGVLAKNPTSVFRQKSFATEFSATLTGKNINELSKIDRVGGSSLTTRAFNNSIQQLRAQL